MDVLVGVDAGGSWLRVEVADLEGNVVRTERVAAGRAHFGVPLADIATTTLRRALADVSVVAGAGSNAAGVCDAWHEVKARAPFISMGEAPLACPPGHGRSLVIVAGTGCAAASVDGTRSVKVTGAAGPDSDGFGSSRLGVDVIRAVKAARKGTGPATALSEACPTTFDGFTHRDVAQLAMVAVAAGAAGDTVAGLLCDNVAAGLAALVDDHDPCYRTEGVRLVGSLVAPGHFIGRNVHQRLAARGIAVLEHHADLCAAASRWAAHLAAVS